MTRPVVGTSARPDWPLAVVVGAGGMGMAIARRLGQRHRLLLADRDAEALAARAATLRAAGHDVSTIACDVTDPRAVAALAGAALARGSFTAFAHVVGLSPSMADFRTIMTVNLIGATLVADAMLAIAPSGSAALFIASIAPHAQPPASELVPILDDPLAPDFLDRIIAASNEEPTPTLAYRLSKAAVIRMCRRRASDWGARGARINSLSPGLIATPMGALEFERQPMKYDLLAATPIKREGTMLEIGDAAEFLLSDRASFISGIDLLVDGGLVATMARH